MASRSKTALVVCSLLMLAGCGHHAKPAEAPTQSDYDWADYTGKFANGAPKDDPKPAAAPAKASADAPAPAAAVATDDKRSQAKIGGLSVSEVSADDVASTTQKMLRSKVVSSNLTVGPEYEQINVVLRGMAVQIVRPANAPDKSGPKVRSPKARNDDLGKTDSSYYDSIADVIVLVQAEKKAASKRALAVLLSQKARGDMKKNVRSVKKARA
ncbi:MAG TPA: hypothetical protein VIF62_32125 [Labilithrix sp.]